MVHANKKNPILIQIPVSNFRQRTSNVWCIVGGWKGKYLSRGCCTDYLYPLIRFRWCMYLWRPCIKRNSNNFCDPQTRPGVPDSLFPLFINQIGFRIRSFRLFLAIPYNMKGREQIVSCCCIWNHISLLLPLSVDVLYTWDDFRERGF